MRSDAEDAHEVVFQGQVEAGGAGVALAAGAAAQLVVDAAGLVALGAQDVEAAQFHHAFAQDDVGAPAGHVGGDGHHALLPGLGHDLGLFLVLLGVEDFVLDAFPLQQLAQVFRFFDGGGAHQHRLAPLVAVLDFLHHGVVLFRLGPVNDVGMVHADHLLVGGDDHDFQLVDLLELLGLGVGGAGHAGQLLVHAEVVLEGDGGQGLVFVLDLDRLPWPPGPGAGRRSSAARA